MQLIIVGDRFEQEIKPLVKSFFQNEPVETELRDFDEEIKNARIKDGHLYYDEYEQDGPEYGLMVYCGEESFNVAFFEEGEVTAFETGKTDPDKKTCRNRLARTIYVILSKKTGIELPWGILTGVRPTKLVYEQAEAGIPEGKIREHMKSEYLCSDEKINVSFEVTNRERALLSGFPYRDEYSLYIGIPFCPTVCAYCSFTSFPLKGFTELVEPYLSALFKEIDASKGLFPGRKISSVYFGGGTPTTLSAEQLKRLIDKVKSSFDLSGCREFTVEAGRPDSINAEKLKVLKECGVGRISINPQSMNDKTLVAIGRRHNAQQIRDAFAMAREYGHDNINMDIILGLTGETPEDVACTLDEIKKLSPDSLTVHTLALKRAARLNIEQKKFKDIGADNVSEMQRISSSFAKENDYRPYYLYRQKNMAENLENVGYSRLGKESLYNILIMEEKQTILALGAGGSSKFVYQGFDLLRGVRIERVENVKNVNHYIERIDEMIQRKADFLQKNSEDLF